MAISLLCCLSFIKITSCIQGNIAGAGWILSGYLTGFGRWKGKRDPGPDFDAWLEERVAGGAKEKGEGLMERVWLAGIESRQKVRSFQKRTQGTKKYPFILEETFPDPVEGALGDVKAAAQGCNGSRLPGKPCVEEADEEAQAVGRIRNDDRKKERMGNPAGAAADTGDGYPVVADRAVSAADQMAFIGAVTGIGRGTAGGAWRKGSQIQGGCHGREDFIVVHLSVFVWTQCFDYMESLDRKSVV